MMSTDVYRPQAREQLALWGEKIGVETLSIIDNEKPLDIVKRGLKNSSDFDVVLIDQPIGERIM